MKGDEGGGGSSRCDDEGDESFIFGHGDERSKVTPPRDSVPPPRLVRINFTGSERSRDRGSECNQDSGVKSRGF